MTFCLSAFLPFIIVAFLPFSFLPFCHRTSHPLSSFILLSFPIPYFTPQLTFTSAPTTLSTSFFSFCCIFSKHTFCRSWLIVRVERKCDFWGGTSKNTSNRNCLPSHGPALGKSHLFCHLSVKIGRNSATTPLHEGCSSLCLSSLHRQLISFTHCGVSSTSRCEASSSNTWQHPHGPHDHLRFGQIWLDLVRFGWIG